MQKIVIALALLCTTFTTVYSQDTQHKKETNARILLLTKDAKLTDLTESPDGKWIAFVKKSNYTIPSNCFYFYEKGEQADEIWIINTTEMTKKLLVAPHFSCGDVSKIIIDPHNLQFSPNSKTLYFETSAWVTSGAIHAVDVDGNHLRFVTDGSELRVVQSGLYKGDIIVNQHRYRFKDDTPLGSYNWDWLFTPTGKQIKLYKKMD
jgi:dipeptidyl aminopeptidase/acylaminoacyl peptidase